jgi:hypothetical protein
MEREAGWICAVSEMRQLAKNRASVTNTMWPVTKMRPALANIDNMLCSVPLEDCSDPATRGAP